MKKANRLNRESVIHMIRGELSISTTNNLEYFISDSEQGINQAISDFQSATGLDGRSCIVIKQYVAVIVPVASK